MKLPLQLRTGSFRLTTAFHILNIFLALIMCWMVFAAAAPLPQRIPTHFAFDGTPDKWGNKDSLTLLMLVAFIVCALLYLLLFLLLPWFQKRPNLLSFPDKERFLALPPEKKQIYWDLIKEFLTALIVCMNFIWASILWGAIQVASQNVKKLPGWAIMPGFVLIMVLCIFYIRRMVKLPGDLISGKR